MSKVTRTSLLFLTALVRASIRSKYTFCAWPLIWCFSFHLEKFGTAIAEIIPMIAKVVINSIRLKPSWYSRNRSHLLNLFIDNLLISIFHSQQYLKQYRGQATQHFRCGRIKYLYSIVYGRIFFHPHKFGIKIVRCGDWIYLILYNFYVFRTYNMEKLPKLGSDFF